jgi:hypothetical protein
VIAKASGVTRVAARRPVQALAPHRALLAERFGFVPMRRVVRAGRVPARLPVIAMQGPALLAVPVDRVRWRRSIRMN